MRKAIFVLIVFFLLFGCTALFVSESIASDELTWQTLTQTANFSCSGSNRPGGPCEGIYLKKDRKWFKFEIPAFSEYELSKMECIKPTLEKDELCNEYSGTCDVLLEGVGMVGGLNPGFTKEPKTIKVRCTQCRTGGFYLTFHPTNCKVEVKYKSYGSCDNYCKSTRGGDFYGQMVGTECRCIRGEKKEDKQKPGEDKRVQNKGCDGGFSDGKCSLVENCQSCPQDCSCPGGMKCKLSGEANFRGCIATAPKIEKLLEEYKENQTKYQELRLYWKRMARLYRANLIKKMMKFVLFDVPAPTPMTVGDLIVDTVNKIQEEVFYKQKMSDEEILVAQRKYLDRLKEEMRPLILRNREIRNEISKLRD